MGRGARGGARRGLPWWVTAVFFFCAGLNLLMTRWLAAAFFLSAGVVFLKHEAIERQTKLVRYLIVAGLAALTVAMFVKLVLDLKSRG